MAKQQRFRRFLVRMIPVLILVCGVLVSVNICPRCLSADTAPIKYGLFPPDAQAVESHKAYPGGCVVELLETHHCFACGRAFPFYYALGWFAAAGAAVVVLVAVWAVRRRRAKATIG